LDSIGQLGSPMFTKEEMMLLEDDDIEIGLQADSSS
jgi:hypothetical protein